MNEPLIQPEIDELKKTPLWRYVLQILGFLVGLSLLIWCIQLAIRGGDFSRLKDAEPRLIALLLGSTVISIAANGTMFWALIRPVTPLGLLEVQFINGVVNLLNYAPVRLGVITRVAHHRRVDHMPYTHLVAWYFAVGVLTLSTFGALFGATILHPRIDLLWAVLALLLLVLAGTVTIWASRHHLLTDRLRGAEKMLDHPAKLLFCFFLRVVDTLAYGTRLYAAFSILGFPLGFQDVVYLTLISMTANILPAGSLGIREWAITKVAPLLTSEGLQSEGTAEATAAMAALVDRAAEAALFVPMGILCVIWMLYRWRRAAALPKQ